jgi:predicted dehydrogenase
MAADLEGIDSVLEAQAASGRRYMMMETSVYGREYRHVERLHREGRLGVLTAYRGVHIQDLDGFPRYWQGFPPMRYLTHALSPILALTTDTVEEVVAYGTGRLTPDRMGPFDNPYPMEVGLFRLRTADIVADTRWRSSRPPGPTSKASRSTDRG